MIPHSTYLLESIEGGWVNMFLFVFVIYHASEGNSAKQTPFRLLFLISLSFVIHPHSSSLSLGCVIYSFFSFYFRGIY